MIEVVSVEEPKRLDITPEMALSAARVLKDFCKNSVHCEFCIVRSIICQKYLDAPKDWNIPKRGDPNGKTD